MCRQAQGISVNIHVNMISIGRERSRNSILLIICLMKYGIRILLCINQDSGHCLHLIYGKQLELVFQQVIWRLALTLDHFNERNDNSKRSHSFITMIHFFHFIIYSFPQGRVTLGTVRKLLFLVFILYFGLWLTSVILMLSK